MPSLWLSPEQVRILPISEKFFDYAREVHEELLEAGIRVKTDTASENGTATAVAVSGQ